jgi:hypothetical protein
MAKMKPQQDTTPDLTDGGEQRTKQKRISMTRKSKKILHKNEQYSHTTVTILSYLIRKNQVLATLILI